MILIASSLALLVIYAGVKLLIQTKRESLSNLFRYAAWFFIIAGFVTLTCAGACCIAMYCKHGLKMMHKENKMMGDDRYKKRYHKGHKKMMKYHHKKHAEGSVVNINCCSHEIEKHCDYGKAGKMDTLKNRK
jgi:hypothetical protein